MAVPQNTLIGKTRQSVGNTTFTTWKGVNVLKSKPVSVANPRTQGQVNQRQMLANFVRLYRTISAIINAGFKQMAVKKSAYNAAASVNLKNESMSNLPNELILAPQFFMAAKGSLYPTPIEDVAADFSLSKISVFWLGDVVADQLNSDKVYVLAIDDNSNVLGVSLGSATRSDLTLDISAPTLPAVGQLIHIYLFFVQTGSGKVSDSAWLPVTVVA